MAATEEIDQRIQRIVGEELSKRLDAVHNQASSISRQVSTVEDRINTLNSDIRNQINANVTEALDGKLRTGEAINAYMTSIATTTANKVFDSRLTPFWKHPTAQMVIVGVLTIFSVVGIASISGEAIRPYVHSFLRIDDSIGRSIQKHQYEAYVHELRLGTFTSMHLSDSDNCNRLREKYLVIDTSSSDNAVHDVVISEIDASRFSNACVDIQRTVKDFASIPFIAEPGEEIEIEILVMAKKSPSLEDGIVNGKLSLNKLNIAFSAGGEFLGRSIPVENLLEARVDQVELALSVPDAMVPIRDATTNIVYDALRFWARDRIAEKSGQFHNLTLTLSEENQEFNNKMNCVVIVFLERNKISRGSGV